MGGVVVGIVLPGEPVTWPGRSVVLIGVDPSIIVLRIEQGAHAQLLEIAQAGGLSAFFSGTGQDRKQQSDQDTDKRNYYQ
jgi:hypothetical protein